MKFDDNNVITVDDENKKKIYMKNNNLIKSKYDISAAENKLYMFLSDKVKRSSDAKDKEYAKVRFKREELFPVFSGQAREAARVSKILSKLIKRSIFIYQKKSNGKERWGEYVFLSSYNYDQETDEFTVVMNAEISELIAEHYLSGYTPMNLDVIYKLNNVYAQRFYELIRLWSWTGSKIRYEVSDLKAYLLLDNKKSYDNFSNFRKKVIEPAIKELNDSGLFKIEYTPIKTGRAVTAIEFTVEDLDNRKYFNNTNNKNVVKTVPEEEVVIVDKGNVKNDFYVPDPTVFTYATLRRFKEDFQDYDFRYEEHREVLEDAIMITLEKDDVEKIKSPSYNFFKKVLKTRLDNFDEQRGKRDAEQMFFNF